MGQRLGSVLAIYVENPAEEDVELCVGQRLGSVQAIYVENP